MEQAIYDGKNFRYLTPIERERLQGFTDDYTKGLSNNERVKCTGNAVCVPLVEHIVSYFGFER
ncbi:MAG: DNA cytosine methyltransferase [Nitrosopumilus sp.]|nr:DNA cytosine methyltransferase [Nitrosopumilus sp.]